MKLESIRYKLGQDLWPETDAEADISVAANGLVNFTLRFLSASVTASCIESRRIAQLGLMLCNIADHVDREAGRLQ